MYQYIFTEVQKDMIQGAAGEVEIVVQVDVTCMVENMIEVGEKDTIVHREGSSAHHTNE